MMAHSNKFLLFLMIMLMIILSPAQNLYAHGGHVSQNQTFTQSIGPYELGITIELPPALPSPLYINVTPQDDFSGAQVTLRAVPHGFPLDQAQSTELGYQPETSVYYTQLEVDRAGDWELDVQVSGPRGTGRARIPFSISVAQLAPNTVALLCTLAIMAVLMVLNLTLTGLAQQRKRPLPAHLQRLMGSLIFASIVAAIIFGAQQFLSQQKDASASSASSSASLVLGRPHANVVMQIEPAQAQVGQPVELSFELSDGSTGLAIDDLITHHDALMHLALIDSSNTSFAHIHPANSAPGHFQITHTFDRAGEYSAYIEIERIDSGIQVLERKFRVSGPEAAPAPAVPGLGRRTFGALQVDVSSSQPPRAGHQTTLSFHFSENGVPITKLVPWLGMAGHMMIRSTDGQIFGHVHAYGPMAGPSDVALQPVFGPDIRFVYTFPQAGRYYIWGQVKYRNAIVTVPLMLDVEP